MANSEDKLAVLRGRIDQIDKTIVDLILERFELVKQITVEKQKRHMAVVDLKRETQILNNVAMMTKERGYSEELKKIFRSIIQTATEFEKKFIKI